MLRSTTETCSSLLWHVVLVTLLTWIVPMFTLHSVDAMQIVVLMLTSNLVSPYVGKLLYGASGMVAGTWNLIFLFCPWIPLRLMLLCLQIEDGCVRLLSKRSLKYMQRHLAI